MKRKHWIVVATAGLFALGGCMGGDGSGASPGETETAEQAIWTANWELIGGAPVSGPGVTQWGPGQNIDVFWRASNNHLKHKWFPVSNKWSSEEDLGGTLSSEPAAIARPNNIRDVFWRGSNNHLMHKSYNKGWSAAEDLGGTLASAPAASSSQNALHVFWKGTNGNIQHKSLDYSTKKWTNQSDIVIPAANKVSSDPAALDRNNGIMDVFWQGPNGHIQHIWYPYGTTWSWVQDLGGTLYSGSAPTAARMWDGRLDLFWRGNDSRLKHIWYPSSTGDWSWEEDLGGNLASSPDATSWGAGRLDVFAKDPGGQMAHKVWNEDFYVDVINQETDGWCSYASAQMIMRYWGVPEVAQCEQASEYNQTYPGSPPLSTACCDAGSPCEHDGGWPQWDWLGFNHTATPDKVALTIAQIKTEVSAHRPWGHAIAWIDGSGADRGGGHYMVGVDEFRFNNDDWVVVNNPNGSGQYMTPYSSYVYLLGDHREWIDEYQITKK